MLLLFEFRNPLEAAITMAMQQVPVDMINRTIMHLQQNRWPQVMAKQGGHFEHAL